LASPAHKGSGGIRQVVLLAQRPDARQYALSFWTILKLALPDKLLKATSDNAPETNSELKFRIRQGVRESFGVDLATGKRRGLRTAVRQLQTAEMASA
jgi:linoleoyl-CoA desaturase